MAWYDLFKLFTYAYTQDPLSKKTNTKDLPSAGVSSPDSVLDLRNLETMNSGGAFIRVQNELVDMTTATNRLNRYKEYDRLVMSVPEIEMAMTVFADEACIAGSTVISTIWGNKTIKWLAENKANDRFPVYCYDFDKEDYTIGWAYSPRYVKTAPTVKIALDNGETEIVTSDHRILKKNGEWVQAVELKFGDELMPFYRINPNHYHTKLNVNQFPRVYTNNYGWLHERQFVDEWKNGKRAPELEKVNKLCRLISSGYQLKEIEELMGFTWSSMEVWLRKYGTSFKEMHFLGQKPNRRRVIGTMPGDEVAVYDLSVEGYENFATDSLIMHNCQKDDGNRCFKVTCKDKEVIDELDFLFFHRDMLNLDQQAMWDKAKRLFIKGDLFWELVINPDNPKDGVFKIVDLPAETMFKIETIRGKTIEFQQTKETPDYNAIVKAPVATATENELQQSTAIRFAPEQIIHIKIGDYRRTFYPYGVSLIEAARGPAHQLRMMEDAMVIYRLCLAGNTRIRTTGSYKYIKDLEIGDTVYSFTESGRQIPTKVELVKNNGKQKVYDVSSKHVRIRGNETHPILINRAGIVQYVDIKDLMPFRDKLILVARNDGFNHKIPRILGETWAKLTDDARKQFKNSRSYKNKSQLMRQCSVKFGRVRQFLYSKGKALPLEKAKEVCEIFGLDESKLLLMNKGEVNSDRVNLPEYVTEEFAKLFGFICGDGTIHNNSQLLFSSSEDDNINNYYCDLLERFFGKVRFELDKRSKKKLGKYVVDSATACKIFAAMGYIHDHHITRIPEWVHTSPKNIRRAFIEGLSDADGTERFTKKGTWFSTIELCNEKLIEDIKELWSSIGLCSGHISKRIRKNKHKIDGRSLPQTTSYTVTITDKLLPKEESITKVVASGEEDVYDITVDSTYHNFIANGIPVHNTRAPERRCFYIDVGALPPYKAEAFMDRIKDQFRKKKVPRQQFAQGGPSAVEERWHAPAQDEDYWLPIRPNSNTRIDTLPGAQNLGEIDDAVYFRNKLFTALNFPKNYFSMEDPNATRITLSAQDVKFARMIERLQSHLEEGLYQIADRHLKLRGFPTESYEDLSIKMTPPSDWRELSRAEIITNRFNNAGSLKGSQLYADFDILTKILKHTEDEAKEMLARLKVQKLEDLKLQILAQNPALLGVGMPGQGEQEMGAEPGGPGGELGPPPEGGLPGQPPMGGPPGVPPPGGQPPPQPAAPGAPPLPPEPNALDNVPPSGQAQPLPTPKDAEIVKYDLEIQDYESEQDFENIDYTDTEG